MTTQLRSDATLMAANLREMTQRLAAEQMNCRQACDEYQLLLPRLDQFFREIAGQLPPSDPAIRVEFEDRTVRVVKYSGHTIAMMWPYEDSIAAQALGVIAAIERACHL